MSRCCDEYCANYGCNQGRDCPVREAKVAKVAKVKRRVPKHAQPLRQEISRVYLKYLAKWVLACMVVLFAAAFVVGVLHA